MESRERKWNGGMEPLLQEGDSSDSFRSSEDLGSRLASSDGGSKYMTGERLTVRSFQGFVMVFLVVDALVTLTFDFFVVEPYIFTNFLDGLRVMLLFFVLGLYYCLEWDLVFIMWVGGCQLVQSSLSWISSVCCVAGITVPKCDTLHDVSSTWSITFNVVYFLIILLFAIYLAWHRNYVLRMDPGAFKYFTMMWFKIGMGSPPLHCLKNWTRTSIGEELDGWSGF